MDALLADALKDFEDDDAGNQQQQEAQEVAALAPCDAGPDPGSAGPSTSTTIRGPALPPRVDAAATTTTSTATSSSPGPSPQLRGGMPQLPARTKKKGAEQQPVQRSEAEQLAEGIIRMLEESGLDFGGGEDLGSEPGVPATSGLPDASQFTSPALRDLAERALQAAESEAAAARAATGSAGSSTGDGAGPGPSTQPQFRSAALQALADQTKQTVQQQSKVSRGEGASSSASSSAAGAGQPGAGAAGGGLFGDLFGMMNALGGEGGAGGGPGGGMGVMVDYIMQNLLSKEVLYGPLKDIRDKYPPWLEANKASLPPEELQRYTAQYASIQAVCKQYEEDPANFQRLVDLIQQMQTFGDPPSPIVDEMAPGAGDGLMGASGDPDDIGNFDMPNMDDLPAELKDKCPIQ